MKTELKNGLSVFTLAATLGLLGACGNNTSSSTGASAPSKERRGVASKSDIEPSAGTKGPGPVDRGTAKE